MTSVSYLPKITLKLLNLISHFRGMSLPSLFSNRWTLPYFAIEEVVNSNGLSSLHISNILLRLSPSSLTKVIGLLDMLFNAQAAALSEMAIWLSYSYEGPSFFCETQLISFGSNWHVEPCALSNAYSNSPIMKKSMKPFPI